MTPSRAGVAEHPERAAALEWAEGARARRAALRAELSDGSRTLADVLAHRADGPDGATKLLYVLESLPGAGKVATRRHLASLGLAETSPLRDLDDATCELLVREFPRPRGEAS